MKFLKKRVLTVNNKLVIYLDLSQKIYKRYFFITENEYNNKLYTKIFFFYFASFEKYLKILLVYNPRLENSPGF